MQPAINGVWRRSRAWPVAESQCGASRGAERAALTLPVGGELFFWPVARIVGGAQRQEGEGVVSSRRLQAGSSAVSSIAG